MFEVRIGDSVIRVFYDWNSAVDFKNAMGDPLLKVWRVV